MNEGLPVFAVWPPSATNAAPFTNDARSEARNITTLSDLLGTAQASERDCLLEALLKARNLE